ncbi:MAG: glycerol kinase GlpK [Acidobacteria bacterium]|nr:glycerol kinase GlpK [Acidobacteriota bacterium]MBI3654794.1 glycerol kinase GlpK [Acidobacteriota bacterium]
MKRYVMAMDQGTSSSRTIIFDTAGDPIGSASQEFQQIYPQPGWVEHDPYEIWRSQIETARRVLADTGISAREIAAIGITNQRETTILWERKTGRPIHNAVVWQCRRTAPLCEELKKRGADKMIREKTGLVLDAYFSGTKVKWLLDNVPGARAQAEAGDLMFGTVDSWLIYKLTGGRVHVTDYTNASRTLLYNIHDHRWDKDLLQALDVPEAILPEVCPSSAVYGETTAEWFGRSIPIAGNAGDQQAALFGQAAFAPGMAKNTYGTGCFLLMNTGRRAVPSQSGLLTTVAAGAGRAIPYALEGSVFMAGAAIQWLRDGLQIINSAADSEKVAGAVAASDGVYVVPAFVGLGAPYWDMYARGTILGITRGTNRSHIVRATLESMAYQSRDVIALMEKESGIPLAELRVDGGATSNALLMQIQADILGKPVVRPAVTETTALGAGYLAGLAVGLWKSVDELAHNWKAERTFEPATSEADRERGYAGWQRAVDRARDWLKPEGVS